MTSPNISPGDRISIAGPDGTVRTEYVSSIGYRSGQPEIRKRLNGWQRAIWRLTPARWRRPIPVVRPATSDRVVVAFSEDSPAERMFRLNERTKAAMLELLGQR